MRAADVITVDVRSLSLEGEGLGSFEEREVAIVGAFPGERVEARVEHVSRQHPRANARLLRVVTPNPARGASPCPDDVSNGGRCTGCALGTLGVDAQREAKSAMLKERFGIDATLGFAGEAFGYRHSAKRIAFRHGPRLGLGSYVRDTHRSASMRFCRVEHPAIARVAAQIEDAATELGIEPFDERTKTGTLRAVWLKTNGDSVLVTLVVTHVDPAVEKLSARLEGVRGVARAIARAAGNDLRGATVTTLRGDESLTITLAGEQVRVGPLSFLQPNPEVAARAYEALVDRPDGSRSAGELAFDLFAGAGVTTAMLRRRFANVIPVESYPESARALGIEPQSVVDFLAKYLASGRPAPELVVANPPRAGLGDAACASLVAIAPTRIAIMSCHPGTLARDLARLEEGGYRRVSAKWFDTLPNTPHVEVVVWMERRA